MTHGPRTRQHARVSAKAAVGSLTLGSKQPTCHRAPGLRRETNRRLFYQRSKKQSTRVCIVSLLPLTRNHSDGRYPGSADIISQDSPTRPQRLDVGHLVVEDLELGSPA